MSNLPTNQQLTRKAALSLTSNLLQQGARLGVVLLTTPIIANGLGKTLYGTWSALVQIVGYVSISDFKPTAALRLTLSVEQHETGHDRKRRLVGAAVTVWVAALPAMFTVAATAVAFAPRLLNIPEALAGEVRVALCVMIAGTILDRVASIPNNILVATNQAYKAMGVTAVSVIVSGGLAALMVLWGFGIAGVAAGTMGGLMLQSAIRYRIARREIEWLGWDRPSRTEVRSMAGRSAWLVLLAACELALNASDIIIVGIVFGPEYAAIYTMTGLAMRMTSGVLLQIQGSASAGISGICGAREWERLHRTRTELLAAFYGVGLASCAGILALNRSFLHVWVGDGYYGGVVLTGLLGVIYMQAMHARLDSLIVDSLMGFGARARQMLLAVAVGLLVGAGGVRVLGLAGVAAGVASGQAVLLFGLRCAIRKMTGGTVRSEHGRLARVLLAGVLLTSVGGVAGTVLPTSGWFRFAAQAVGAGLAVGSTMFFIGFDRKTRRALTDRAASALAALRRGAPHPHRNDGAEQTRHVL
jgi:O-antigen/teichoic acid export membrane protein